MANDNTNAVNIVPGPWVKNVVTPAPGVHNADHRYGRGDTLVLDDHTPDNQDQSRANQEHLRRDSTFQDDGDLQTDGQYPQASSEILPTKPTLSVSERHSNLPYWNPIWLRKPILIAFALVNLGCLLAVVVLYLVSNSRHGLSHQKSNNHYTWKYGPTASKSTYSTSTTNADSCSNHRTCHILVPARSLLQTPRALVLDERSTSSSRPYSLSGLSLCFSAHYSIQGRKVR
jgi:hypothetical protein